MRVIVSTAVPRDSPVRSRGGGVRPGARLLALLPQLLDALVGHREHLGVRAALAQAVFRLRERRQRLLHHARKRLGADLGERAETARTDRHGGTLDALHPDR
ncbi:hypothetical protein ACFZAD_39895 [Streptomyces iakyrus]|uniref:hypothetical protein n=1 Tax=Streptomyces iakyrus TaxID=68219 RepID=UPI0036EFC19B